MHYYFSCIYENRQTNNSKLRESGIKTIFELVVVSLVGIYDLTPSKHLQDNTVHKYEPILYNWHKVVGLKDKGIKAFRYKQYISDLKLYKHTAEMIYVF